MEKRVILKQLFSVVTLFLLLSWPSSTNAGETLYNGINLPSQWPPEIRHYSREPMPVPYLLSLPDVVCIDVGRQMFVDDFLIEETTLKRIQTNSDGTVTLVSSNPDIPPMVYPAEEVEIQGVYLGLIRLS